LKKLLLLLFLSLAACPGASFSSAPARIVFVLESGGTSDLYIVNSDGSGLRQLTRDAFVEENPRWSPDGKLIAFDSTRGGGSSFSIWTMNPGTGEFKRLTGEGEQATFLTWLSPSEISFVSPLGSGNSALGLLDLKNGKKRILTRLGGEYIWSPDGSRAVVQMVEPDYHLGMVKRRSGTFHSFPRYGKELSPAWSPDGRKIAFQEGPAGGGKQGIWVMNIDGTGRKRLAPSGYLPQWLPGGSGLGYYIPGPDGEPHFHIVRPDGTGDRDICRGTEASFSAALKQVAFLREGALWVAGARGKGEVRLLDGVVSFSWASSGRMILSVRETTGGRSGRISDVVLVDPATRRLLALSGGKGRAGSPSLEPGKSLAALPGRALSLDGPPPPPHSAEPPAAPERAPGLLPQEPPPAIEGIPAPREEVEESSPSGPAKQPEGGATLSRGLVQVLALPPGKDATYLDAAWSPDSRDLIFCSRKRARGGQIYGELLRVRADGKGLRKIFTPGPEKFGGNNSCLAPRFSPDGKMAAFLTACWFGRREGYHESPWTIRLEDNHLYSLDIYNVRRLRDPLPSIYSPAGWNADSRFLLFGSVTASGMGREDRRISGLWRVGATGSGSSRLVESSGVAIADSSPSWSPDGMMLAFMEKSQGEKKLFVWTNGEDMNTRVPVASAPAGERAGAHNDVPLHFQWLSDGRTLAFLSREKISLIDTTSSADKTRFIPAGMPAAINRNGSVIVYGQGRELRALKTADGKQIVLKRMQKNFSGEDSLSFSPDGSRILLCHGGGLYIFRLPR